MQEAIEQMDAGARKWLIKHAYRNMWRVESFYTLTDLIQDGYWHYYRLRRKYPHVEKRSHIMSLFTRTFANHIHDLSKRRTRLHEIPACDLVRDDQREQQYWDEVLEPEPDHESLVALMIDAPAPLRALLSLFSNAEGLKQMQALYRQYKDGTRETLNGRLCRLTGQDPDKTDLVDTMKQYLHAA